MSNDDNDAGIVPRNKSQDDDFLGGAKTEEQVEEVLPPNHEAEAQNDEILVEDLQLPSSSHHDLPRN